MATTVKNTPANTPKAPVKAPVKASVGKTPAKAAAAKPVLVITEGGAAEAVKVNPAIKLKELVDRVVAASGGNKKGVKAIVEATLTQLGDALQKGETLNLPSFGKLRVARQQDLATGSAMTLKLRRGTGGGSGDGAAKRAAKEALAPENDQG